MTACFTLGERAGRRCLLTPEGRPFFSLGLNHFDPAALCYPDSGGVWESDLKNQMERFVRQMRADLDDWGFNTIGWVQEVVIRTPQYHRHSRNFTFEEYQWADMPYCHLLPFAETHQWEAEVRLPDFRAPAFEEWCDYVARAHCARFRDDPKLIGYFYTDCPVWVHTHRDSAWRGSLFDPARLESEAGRRELFELADRYYRVTRDAIRRYDPHHLILGDRYEAKAPLPGEVVRAALPYVDVMCFQCFDTPDKTEAALRRWAEFSGKPVLLADAAGRVACHCDDLPGETVRLHDLVHYRDLLDRLWNLRDCVGFHLCGAYVRNRARESGLRDHRNRVFPQVVDGLREINAGLRRRIEQFWA